MYLIIKCKVGDKVRFLNDVGGGKIVRVINNRTVAVLNEDGFEIPTLVSEIIVVDSSSDQVIGLQTNEENENETFEKRKGEVQQLQVSVTETKTPTQHLSLTGMDDNEDEEGEELSIHVAFVPHEQLNAVDSDQDFYIINDSTYRVVYIVGRWNRERNAIEPINVGNLLPDSKELVKTFTKNELKTPIAINIQAVFYKNRSYVAQQPEFFDLEINPVKFYRPGSFTENDFFEENAMVFTIVDTQKEVLVKSLSDKVIEKSIAQKDIKPKQVIKVQEPELVEVDLHIHEIVDNYTSLQPGEMLEIQLARFSTALDTGIKSNTTRKMVFIHGLGNGKLKNEIIRKLQREYPKLRYQDASFKEYGFGATMVFTK